MAKRGLFVSIIVALITFLMPSVIAQGWIKPFDEILNVMVNNQFFSFLFFFGLFFAACAAALSKVFPGTYGRFIALFLSLIMTVGGVYTGYLDLVTFGPWSLLFLLILIGVGILYFFVMGREKAPNYKVILLVSFVIGLIVISFVPNIPDLIWNWLFAAVIVLGVSGIIALALNLAGGIKLSTKKDTGRMTPRERQMQERLERLDRQRREREARGKQVAEPLHVTIINPQKRPPVRNDEYQVGDRIPLIAEIIGGAAPYNSRISVISSKGKTIFQRRMRTQGDFSIPNIHCPEGESVIEVETTDSGRRVMFGMLRRGRQRAVDAVIVFVQGAGAAPSKGAPARGAKPAEARAERAKGFIGKIISPKGEIKSDKKILLEIDIRGGVAPYKAELFFDGNRVKVGSYDLSNPGRHPLSLESSKGLGMLEGTKHVIEVEFTDSEGTRVSDSTEIFTSRPMPAAKPERNLKNLLYELNRRRVVLSRACTRLAYELNKLKLSEIKNIPIARVVRTILKIRKSLYNVGQNLRYRNVGLWDYCDSLSGVISTLRDEIKIVERTRLVNIKEVQKLINYLGLIIPIITDDLEKIAKETGIKKESISVESLNSWIKKQK